MARTPLRLGTRGSKLALIQAENIRQWLAPFGVDVEPVVIKTSGDQGIREQLGAFVKEIQVALLDHRVDAALHCLKDLPTQAVPGLEVGAYLKREDPADAFISKGPTWQNLPAGSVVGTGSIRRTAQLKAHRPDLVYRPLVGNVDTRIQKLRDGEYDAIVLAMAGLGRMGWLEAWPFADLRSEALSYGVILPAAGQGILILETRSGENRPVRHLHDPASEAAALAERHFLSSFGGGCSLPVAAYATVTGSKLSLRGIVSNPEGTDIRQADGESSVDDAIGLGQRLGQELIAAGALSLLPEASRG